VSGTNKDTVAVKLPNGRNCDIQHIFFYLLYCYAECRYTECRGLLAQRLKNHRSKSDRLPKCRGAKSSNEPHTLSDELSDFNPKNCDIIKETSKTATNA